MSVYTPVSKETFDKIVDNYALGSLLGVEGIKGGVTNTIYQLETSEGRYVFTLFEVLRERDLTFYLELMQYLHDKGIKCQHPIKDRQGQWIGHEGEKPFILCPYLEGAIVELPDEGQCFQVAEALGQLHQVGQGFGQHQTNPMGIQWCLKTYEGIKKKLTLPQQRLIEGELKRHARINYKLLPQGIVHADLFRDNVIFDGKALVGFIDWYYACWDTLIIDLAILINDWCLSQRDKAQRLVNACLEGYRSARQTDEAEKKLLAEVLCFVALRFWLSRLRDSFLYEDSPELQVKDPKEYEILLNFHRARAR